MSPDCKRKCKNRELSCSGPCLRSDTSLLCLSMLINFKVAMLRCRFRYSGASAKEAARLCTAVHPAKIPSSYCHSLQLTASTAMYSPALTAAVLCVLYFLHTPVLEASLLSRS
jgi:hypothetical protein